MLAVHPLFFPHHTPCVPVSKRHPSVADYVRKRRKLQAWLFRPSTGWFQESQQALCSERICKLAVLDQWKETGTATAVRTLHRARHMRRCVLVLSFTSHVIGGQLVASLPLPFPFWEKKRRKLLLKVAKAAWVQKHHRSWSTQFAIEQ